MIDANDVSPADQAGSDGSTGLAGSDLGGVLNRIRDWLARFICPMYPRDLDLLTLWIAHTHLAEETYTTPRLLIESPVPESGKTTVLEHLERLCFHPLQMALVTSDALLVRVLEDGLRTLLIDEADRSLNPDKPGVASVIAVLNSGYKKGATRPVLVPVKGNQWETREMSTFAPVVMAGNQPQLPDDTLSRVIRILIMPDHDGTVDDSDWELIEPEAKALAEDLALWADSIRDQVRDGDRPTLPEGAKGRTKERWLPLKRVAIAASDRWPDVVDQLVRLDLDRMQLEREEGIVAEKPHVTLLRNIADLWEPGEAFYSTEDLISMLTARFPFAWGRSDKYPKGLTPQRLGRMLVKNYGVHSDRTTASKIRGYYARDFDRACRSVRIPPIEPAKPVEPKPNRHFTAPTGEGRCDSCGFHTETQGHRDGCQQMDFIAADANGEEAANGRVPPNPEHTGAKAAPPGAPTANTPGYTDRVKAALAQRSQRGRSMTNPTDIMDGYPPPATIRTGNTEYAAGSSLGTQPTQRHRTPNPVPPSLL